MFDELYVVGPGSDYGNAMWSDFNLLENGQEFSSVLSSRDKLICLLHHIHFSFLLNHYFDLPLQRIWKRFYSLETIDFDDRKNYFVLLPDVSACRMDKKYLETLHKKSNVCLVLFIVNTMSRKTRLLLERTEYFSYVFSFCKEDAERYGFHYYDAVYSKQDTANDSSIQRDAFFAGTYSPQRLALLRNLSKRMTEAGLQYEFRLNGVNVRDIQNDGIIYNMPLSYSEALKRTLTSNCLIEVLGVGGACGFTMRTAEAVCYNKRLITNNPLILQSEYYDPEKILLIKDADDIDLAFIKDRRPVAYHYNGLYSPLKLLETEQIRNWRPSAVE